MRLRKILAAAAMIAALAPFAAAARAACCLPKPAKHACCAAETPSQRVEGRGCCKVPKAPAPDTRSQDRSPLGVVAAGGLVPSPATGVTALPAAPALRLARLGSRAPAPDVSPPDLLARYATLLI